MKVWRERRRGTVEREVHARGACRARRDRFSKVCLAIMLLISLFLACLLSPLEATHQGASWAPDAHQHGATAHRDCAVC